MDDEVLPFPLNLPSFLAHRLAVNFMFVSKRHHMRAVAEAGSLQTAIARIARGWAVREAMFYDGSPCRGEIMLIEPENPSTLTAIRYGFGFGNLDPPSDEVQEEDMRMLARRINQWCGQYDPPQV